MIVKTFCLAILRILPGMLISINVTIRHQGLLCEWILGQAKLIYSLSSGLFLKYMRAGGHFLFFIISFGPVHVATETII